MAILTTVSLTIKAFYIDLLEALNTASVKTTVICADDPDLRKSLPYQTRFIPVNFTRIINPLKDMKVLWQLFKFFRREKFDLVQYSTLKAALLGSIASFLAGVPIRIYAVWGFYFEGQKGVKKTLFKFLEKMCCSLSTLVSPNSHEMVDFAVKQGLTKRSKCQVILNGSACGVDLELFDSAKWQHSREQMRDKLNIPEDSVVIGAFGRLTGDKGINELVAAFNQIAEEIDNAFLLVVGGQEEKDRLLVETQQAIMNHPKIRTLDWRETLLPCYATIDIFCLPSYREGFPQTPLEAQAMKMPVVCTNIRGSRKAVVDNHTGFLVEPRDSQALIEPLKRLILDAELRKQMGQKGRERIKQMFDSKNVIQAIVEHRLKLLSKVERRPE